MSIDVFDAREENVGTGLINQYTFSFLITQLQDITILLTDSNYNLIFEVNGTDTVNLTSVVFDPINGGGTITFVNNVPNGYFLTLLLTPDSPVQPTEYRNKGAFTLRQFERSLDYLTTAVQRVAYLAQRSVRIGDNLTTEMPFNTQLPIDSNQGVIATNNANCVIAVNSTGNGFTLGPSVVTLASQAAQAIASAAAAAVSAAAALVSQTTAAASAAAAVLSAASAAASAAIATGAVTEVQQTIANNQSAAANITGFSVDGTKFQYAKMTYELYRYNGSSERMETGEFSIEYLPIAGSWRVANRVSSTDALNNGNTSLSVTTVGTVGQVQYTSDNFSGQTVGKIRYKLTTIGVFV